jgi:hypothetical protein
MTTAREHHSLDALLDQAQILRSRLQRLTFALAVAEDCAADEFERVAGSSPAADSRTYLVKARAARADAETCRDIGSALERAHG